MLTRALARLGITGFDLYSAAGVILVLGFTYFPIVGVTTAAGARGLDGRLEEAALLAGGRVRMFLAVTLPLLLPAVVLGSGCVFLLGLLSFSVPSLLQTPVYTVEIYARFSAVYDPAAAVAQSLPLLVFALLGFVVWARVLRPRYRRLSGFHRPRSACCPGVASRLAAAAYCACLALLCAGLPLAVLVARAMPPASFLQAWATAREEILTSLALAAVTATLGVTLALVLAYFGEEDRSDRSDRSDLVA